MMKNDKIIPIIMKETETGVFPRKEFYGRAFSVLLKQNMSLQSPSFPFIHSLINCSLKGASELENGVCQESSTFKK